MLQKKKKFENVGLNLGSTIMSKVETLAPPKLNLRRIRRWIREFSKAIEMPEILNDLEKILMRGRKPKTYPL